MALAIVTGSGGLIGSESVAHFVEAGFDVIGLENDMRADFFGPAASTRPSDRAAPRRVSGLVPLAGRRHPRRRRGRAASSPTTRPRLELVIHTAAQPSHDWAASDPHTDFGVNANGTLNLLEATRQHKPGRDVRLHLDEQGLRRPAEPPAARGARDAPRAARRTTSTSAGSDRRCRSTAACTRCSARRRPRPTSLVQEYGRYFDMPTVCFRGGCLTGPNHAGASCTASSPT